jgi:hypothetical protein
MRWSCIALVLAFATRGEGGLLRGHSESLEVSGDWAALTEAESEDRSFLISQLDQTEAELQHLQHFIEATGHPTVLAGLQISATPTEKKASVAAKPAVKAPEAKKEVAPAAKKEVATTKTAKKEAAPADMDPAKVAASLGIPSGIPGMKGAMALAPMLAMLKGLYQDSKDRISQQNVREEKSKKWFTEKEADHKTKLSTIEGKFQNHTLSEEFRTNETRDEMRYFNYWERCRQRQHRQFHTNLKIQHAMMTKVKKMVDMYEKALSPKAADQKVAKKDLSQMTGMPEIVFLQRTVSSFCTESLAEVRKERDELQEPLGVDAPY